MGHNFTHYNRSKNRPIGRNVFFFLRIDTMLNAIKYLSMSSSSLIMVQHMPNPIQIGLYGRAMLVCVWCLLGCIMYGVGGQGQN